MFGIRTSSIDCSENCVNITFKKNKEELTVNNVETYSSKVEGAIACVFGLATKLGEDGPYLKKSSFIARLIDNKANSFIKVRAKLKQVLKENGIRVEGTLYAPDAFQIWNTINQKSYHKEATLTPTYQLKSPVLTYKN